MNRTIQNSNLPEAGQTLLSSNIKLILDNIYKEIANVQSIDQVSILCDKGYKILKTLRRKCLYSTDNIHILLALETQPGNIHYITDDKSL